MSSAFPSVSPSLSLPAVFQRSNNMRKGPEVYNAMLSSSTKQNAKMLNEAYITPFRHTRTHTLAVIQKTQTHTHSRHGVCGLSAFPSCSPSSSRSSSSPAASPASPFLDDDLPAAPSLDRLLVSPRLPPNDDRRRRRRRRRSRSFFYVVVVAVVVAAVPASVRSTVRGRSADEGDVLLVADPHADARSDRQRPQRRRRRAAA